MVRINNSIASRIRRFLCRHFGICKPISTETIEWILKGHTDSARALLMEDLILAIGKRQETSYILQCPEGQYKIENGEIVAYKFLWLGTSGRWIVSGDLM